MPLTLVCTLATVGAFGFATRALGVVGHPPGSALVVIVACGVAGLAASASLGRHVRLSIVTVLASAAIAAGGGRLLLHAANQELATLLGPLLVALAALVTAGGGLLGRYLATPHAPTSLSLWLLGGLVTQGLMFATAVPLVALDTGPALTALAILACAFAGGFVTQAVSSVRRVWACGGGAMLMILLMGDVEPPFEVWLALVPGFAVFACLGALGARVAVAIWPRPVHAIAVPAASVVTT